MQSFQQCDKVAYIDNGDEYARQMSMAYSIAKGTIQIRILNWSLGVRFIVKEFNIEDVEHAEEFFLQLAKFFNLPIGDIYKRDFEKIKGFFAK